jgi:hypothetical protein
MQTGLYALRFDGLLPRIRSSLLFPADGDTVVPPSPVTFRWRQAASQPEDPHYYELHIVGPGIDSLFATRDTSCLVSVLPGFQSGQNYFWHVRIKDEFTEVTSQDTFSFVYGAGSLGASTMTETPPRFLLAQNYPNPFNPNTKIVFAVGSRGPVSLKVYDMLGREVATLVDEVKGVGEYEASFDASHLSGGVYLCRMTAAEGFGDTRKLLLLK